MNINGAILIMMSGIILKTITIIVIGLWINPIT